jgi:hypothetical protein
VSIFDLFKKRPRIEGPMTTVTLMSSDAWLDSMLETLDEKDRRNAKAEPQEVERQ